MAYQINKTDGTIIAEVVDGQIDQISTDLTLIGKNFSGFGESLNENFVKLLENFADTTAPTAPLQGQIWYDTTDGNVKVYNGNQFVPVSSAVVADTQPQTIGVGDLWYNNLSRQLFFFNGTESILLGPDYSASQGRSGIEVQSILDSENQTRIITVLYINNVLFGIFSKDKFIPARPIAGFSENTEGVLIAKEILPGFNIGTHKVRVADPETGEITEVPLTFRVTSKNAENLGDQPAASYVRNDIDNTIVGLVEIQSDLGISIGDSKLANISISNDNLIIANNNNQGEILLNVRQGESPETAINIKPPTRTVEIYPDFEDSQTVIGGDLTVGGNLLVQGSTTTINTSELTVEDKSIELAKVNDPTDDTADQGGIILKGATDKLIMWVKTPTEYPLADSSIINLKSYAWNFSDHINLAKNKYYAIDGVPVIEQTSDVEGSQTFKLTEAVTAIEGVTSFGKQTLITVGSGDPLDEPVMRIEDNRISINPGSTDLELAVDSGNVLLINSPKIVGLADPENAQDAATKEYVDDIVETRSIVLSTNITDDISPAEFATDVLPKLAPLDEYRSGTIARVLCTKLTNVGETIGLNPFITDTKNNFVTDVNFEGETTTTSQAVTEVSGTDITIAPQPITVTRSVWTFIVDAENFPNKTWEYVGAEDL